MNDPCLLYACSHSCLPLSSSSCAFPCLLRLRSRSLKSILSFIVHHLVCTQLNHYRPRETKWTFDEDLQAFTITSLQHICPGSQVYDSYGQKCNHRFLLNYGFAVEDNRELDGFCPNEVPLELYVDPEDALFYEKLEFWTRGETSQSSSSAVAAMAAMHATKTMTASFLASHITSNNQYQQQQQHPYNHQHHNHHHESIDNVMAQPPVVKRVRVCVSNNENTRLLFSLLRALACNAQELRAIRGGGGSGGITLSLTLAKSNDNNSSSFFQQPASTSSAIGALAAEAAHFRQYHNSSLTAASSFPLSLSSSPPSSSPLTSTSSAPYHRSCRDIRHPISIRNERAAMRLLLEIIGRHLSAYPTSLSQDVADLMDEEAFPRFSNLRHAKIQVRGEKQVLHHFALWARTALDVLDVIEEELKEERGSVEVKLTRNGRTVTEERPGFDYIIRRMEDDCDREHNSNYGLNHHQQHNNEHININIHTIGGPGGNSGPPIHHTILRYCADVLGSLRREETKNIKRQRAAAMSHHHHHQQQHQQNHHQQHYHPHGGSPYRSNSAGSSAVGGSGQHSNSNTMGQGSHGNMQSTSPQQQQQYRNYPHYNAASNSNGARGQPQQQQSPEHHHHSHSGASPGDRGGSNRPYSGDSPSSGYM
jgi:Rubisco LSMT substrate-binding